MNAEKIARKLFDEWYELPCGRGWDLLVDKITSALTSYADEKVEQHRKEYDCHKKIS